MSTLAALRSRGFDLSAHVPFTRRTYRVRCSQCEALVINGYATHEPGCLNDAHECRGCSTLIPVAQRWCDDCTP